ncbi:MAG: thioredoxin family protein [Flavobacteriales bacterium]|nr:thioredoxin family protein [Flavobacteriales bacterium]
MKKHTALGTILLFLIQTAYAQVNYQGNFDISFSMPELGGKQIFLAYPLMGKTYISDTVSLDAAGKGNLKTTIEKGVYYVVYPPDNNYFQIMLDNEPKFVVKADINRIPQSLSFTGSPQNTRFYAHLNKTERLKQIADSVNQLKTIAQTRKNTLLDSIQNRFEIITGVFSSQYKGTLATEVVRLSQRPPYKEGKTDNEKVQMFDTYKQEFKKLLVLDDPRLLRTPDFYERITTYLDDLTVQQGDSVSAAVDFLLNKAVKDKEVFKVVLVDLLNKYAKSNKIWGEDVYCHLALKYYATGKADWIEKETLEKIVTNARQIEPTRIGKEAADFSFLDLFGNRNSLYNRNGDYLVLFFVNDNAKNNESEIKELVKAHDALQNGTKQIQFLTFWMSPANKENQEAFYAKYNMYGKWFYNFTPENVEDVKQHYNLKTYPRIVIIDKNKTIVYKKISADIIAGLLK